MIQVNRSGEWISAEELKAELLAWQSEGPAPVLDLAGIDYLEGSCLQVIVAFQKEHGPEDKAIHFENLSSMLFEWINFAGATKFFSNQPGEVSN